MEATLWRDSNLPPWPTCASDEEETSPRLTVREEQIISLCADGMLDREIAERLDISESTVRKHMQGILKKLNCKTARQAVALWVRSHAR